MRILLQRVSQASVSIEGSVKSAIGLGLLVLVGFEDTDTPADLEWGVNKLTRMRIFDDAQGVMNLSVQDVGGDLLIVSQFTLQADIRRGNRPSYIQASKPEVAIPLYHQFVAMAQQAMGKPVGTGTFGADMQVQLINNGPVTIWIDTRGKNKE